MSDLEKARFLHDELFYLTLMAVVQRGYIYSKESNAAQRDLFVRSLRGHLDRIAKNYSAPTTEEVHVHNIDLLAEKLSTSCGTILQGGRFRIGSAQKALNLFLKYLWCLGEIPEPPHCPFDRQIIDELPATVRCSWVKCNDIKCYWGWVTEARKMAESKSQSLAQWELATYNRK